MPLHVENITGRRVMYNIVLENTVEKLKELIFITENLPVHRQVLIFGQRTLEDNMKLSSYGVSDDSTIKLLILPRSGPINEKRGFVVDRYAEEPFDASVFEVPEAPAYSVEDLTRILVTCLLKKTDKTRLVSSTGDVNGMNENNDFDENLASTSTFIPPSSDLASNLRTMQRLKDLRCSMERLDQMRAKKKQFYEQDIIQGQMRAENAVGYCKSRQRRTSGCLGGSRSLSSRYANYQQQKDYLISADDTSAKESSAGETELDDYAVASGSYTTGGVQHGKNVVSAQGLIALKKYFACEPHLVVKSSSCSDLDRNNGSVDPEREKLLKSDSDQEYITTTEYFNVSDPNLFRHELKSIGKIVIKTGFNDNVGSSEENDQNYSEDPASSGAVIYDHLLSARRFKVKKKNTGIRQHCAQKNKHSAVDDSTDDPKRRNPKPYHSFRGTYVFRPAGVCIPMIQRRTRSKSRLMPQQTVPHLFEKTAPSHGNNQFTTTGDETSSDECATQHSIRINDPLLTNKSAKTSVLPKCKFPNFRAASAQKKAWISSGAPPEKGMSPIACTSSLQQHSFLESTDEFTAPSSYTLPRHHKLPQSSHAQQRCNVCSSRLTLGTTFHCRCGKTTCPRHRNAESHACGYDFRRSAATAAAIIACIDATSNSQNMASSSGSQNDHRTHNLGGDEKTHFP